MPEAWWLTAELAADWGHDGWWAVAEARATDLASRAGPAGDSLASFAAELFRRRRG